VLSRLFLIASTIGELLGSYQEYTAKLLGKQKEEFLMEAEEKRGSGILYQEFNKIDESSA
jgi:hypothetical protein